MSGPTHLFPPTKKSNQIDVPKIIARVIIYILIHERALGDVAIP